MHKIVLKKGKEVSLSRKHPWVFSGAIKRIPKSLDEGDVVGIYSSADDFLAKGHYQDGSIALRIISFEEEEIDLEFWVKKLSEAQDLRARLGLLDSEQTNCYRLIHAEGDGLPGLIIDIYGQAAVIQAHSIGMHKNQGEIAKALKRVYGDQITTIYSKSEATLPDRYSEFIEDKHLLGNADEGEVKENGCCFKVNWVTGQKTGFFLDQRVNRALLASYAEGKTILNTFAYSGGFSIYGLAHGAEKVVSADISAKAVELIDENVEINFGKSLSTHQSLKVDVMKYLKQEEENFDIVLVDPPAFAKNLRKRHKAVIGYKQLNAMAINRVKKGGLLFTFSCSQVVDDKLFYDTIVAAAIQAGRRARVLHKLSQSPDHPVSIFHKEGHYLKGLVLYIE